MPELEELKPEQPKPTVTPGYSGLTGAAGMRYKGTNSGREIYLGVGDLGVGSNRVEADYPAPGTTWPEGRYAVTFAFDKPADKITTSIDGPGAPGVTPAVATVAKSLEYPLAAPACASSDWDTLDILLADRLDPAELSFENVTLDGFPLGDFETEGWTNWTVTGVDLGKGFTLSGELVVKGTWGSNETSKLQVTAGCLP